MISNLDSSWKRWGVTLLATVVLAGCSSGGVRAPVVEDTWQPPEGAEAVTPASCDENHDLFAYDAQAPLDTQEVSRDRQEGVTVIDMTYASPMGGRVPATLVVPDGTGPFAGMLLQHGMPSTRHHLIPGAVTYARMGAVVLLIDAPFARRPNGLEEPLTFTEQDRREQIQLIIDLRRGVDLLLARSDVDPDRLAYVGISYGGAMGGLLADVEDRLKAYVLQVGDGGLVTHSTGAEDMDWWLAMAPDLRRQWVAWMWPIEPIRYVGCAAPAALLFQNGTLDAMVPPVDAARYQEAGSEPKTIRWYKDGHGLGAAAGQEQAEWLSEMIGISSRRAIPQSAEVVLSAWFVAVAASLVLISVDLWRTRPTPRGSWFSWLLTTAFLGPVGLLIYWTTGRRPRGESETQRSVPPGRRALGSAAWAAAGNVLGAVGVLALLIYFPDMMGRSLVLQIAVMFLLPFTVGGLAFAFSRWLSRSDAGYGLAHRRPMFAEAASTSLVLAGVFPVLSIAASRAIDPWTSPFGFSLFHRALWGALCLATLAGTLVTYPFHVWMIRRGIASWGEVPPADQVAGRRPSWYVQVALFLLSFIVMLAAIFLSMEWA